LIHIKFCWNKGNEKSRLFSRTHPVYQRLLRGTAVSFRGGGVTPAYAACVSGAQCEANGFAETPANNDSFQAIGANLDNAALKAINGGAITGSGLTIDATSAGYGAYADGNGQITLTGAATGISGFRGIRAQGGGSVTMTDGKIDTIESAVEVLDNGSVTLTDVTVEKGSGNGSAIAVGPLGTSNASFTMTGGSLTTSGGGVQVAGTDNHVTLTNVTVNNTTGGALWVNGSDDSVTLTLNGGTTITDTGDGAAVQLNRGKLVMDDASLNVTNGPGISMLAGSDTANLEANKFSIDSTASMSGRHAIQIGMNSKADLTDGTITTTGDGVYGIWITGNNQPDALVTDNVTFTTSGANSSGVNGRGGTATLSNSHFVVTGVNSAGVYSDSFTPGQHSIINMTGGDITTNAAASRGVFVVRGGEAHLDKVNITVTGTEAAGLDARSTNTHLTFKNGTINAQGSGHGAYSLGGALVEIDASQITVTGANHYGLAVQSDAAAVVSGASSITTTGTGSVGLGFRGLTASNTILFDDSQVSSLAAGAMAVLALGGENRLDATNSTLAGDTLVVAGDADDGFGTFYGADLDLNSDNSVLSGHATVSNLSTLTMNLTNGSDWTLRQSSGGTVRSDVTFLNLDESRIVFDAASLQRQTLVVGTGERNGSTAVYNAFSNARIDMNTFFDAGGALANQTTDRLVINGDVLGTTLLTVNALPGSPGALTGDTANDGISIVQVYGNASASSFALAGGYVPVGVYEYKLYAFDPGQSDASQRDATGTGGSFWDFRLQSGGSGGAPKTLLAQAPRYLSAPNAIFQARLLDIGTLHRRMGATLPAESGQRDFFLRTYGGDYTYHSQRSARQYGYDADTRYHAVQGGGNVYGVNNAESSWRFGIAGSTGDLSFQPRRVAGSHKTRMEVWSVSPTVTWQHTNGAYVDALVAVGGFKGDVANRNNVATTLEGQSRAVSVEAGLPLSVAGLTVEPQVQAVYQRLKFDALHDADGLDVRLGTLALWTLRAGGKVARTFDTAAGHRVQVYGKAHVSHGVHNGNTVSLAERFRLGRFGTTAEIGLGVNAAFAKDRATVTADVTRQTRVGRAGHQGWAVNLGARVRF